MQELDLTKRVEVLETLLEGLAPLSIAFSGGFYSRFLIFMAARLGLEIDIFHGAGPHIPASETAFARSWVDIVDLPFHEYMLDPLEIPAVEAGAKDRCDACTHALFASLRETVEEESTLCGGSTYSDDPACYSTVKNLEAFDVRSPLASGTPVLINSLAFCQYANTGLACTD